MVVNSGDDDDDPKETDPVDTDDDDATSGGWGGWGSVSDEAFAETLLAREAEAERERAVDQAAADQASSDDDDDGRGGGGGGAYRGRGRDDDSGGGGAYRGRGRDDDSGGGGAYRGRGRDDDSGGGGAYRGRGRDDDSGGGASATSGGGGGYSSVLGGVSDEAFAETLLAREAEAERERAVDKAATDKAATDKAAADKAAADNEAFVIGPGGVSFSGRSDWGSLSDEAFAETLLAREAEAERERAVDKAAADKAAADKAAADNEAFVIGPGGVSFSGRSDWGSLSDEAFAETLLAREAEAERERAVDKAAADKAAADNEASERRPRRPLDMPMIRYEPFYEGDEKPWTESLAREREAERERFADKAAADKAAADKAAADNEASERRPRRPLDMPMIRYEPFYEGDEKPWTESLAREREAERERFADKAAADKAAADNEAFVIGPGGVSFSGRSDWGSLSDEAFAEILLAREAEAERERAVDKAAADKAAADNEASERRPRRPLDMPMIRYEPFYEGDEKPWTESLAREREAERERFADKAAADKAAADKAAADNEASERRPRRPLDMPMIRYEPFYEGDEKPWTESLAREREAERERFADKAAADKAAADNEAFVIGPGGVSFSGRSDWGSLSDEAFAEILLAREAEAERERAVDKAAADKAAADNEASERRPRRPLDMPMIRYEPFYEGDEKPWTESLAREREAERERFADKAAADKAAADKAAADNEASERRPRRPLDMPMIRYEPFYEGDEKPWTESLAREREAERERFADKAAADKAAADNEAFVIGPGGVSFSGRSDWGSLSDEAFAEILLAREAEAERERAVDKAAADKAAADNEASERRPRRPLDMPMIRYEPFYEGDEKPWTESLAREREAERERFADKAAADKAAADKAAADNEASERRPRRPLDMPMIRYEPFYEGDEKPWTESLAREREAERERFADKAAADKAAADNEAFVIGPGGVSFSGRSDWGSLSDEAFAEILLAREAEAERERAVDKAAADKAAADNEASERRPRRPLDMPMIRYEPFYEGDEKPWTESLAREREAERERFADKAAADKASPGDDDEGRGEYLRELQSPQPSIAPSIVDPRQPLPREPRERLPLLGRRWRPSSGASDTSGGWVLSGNGDAPSGDQNPSLRFKNGNGNADDGVMAGKMRGRKSSGKSGQKRGFVRRMLKF